MASVNKRGPVLLKPDAGGFGEKHRCQEQEGAFASFTGSRNETPAVRGRQCHLGRDGLQQIDFRWGVELKNFTQCAAEDDRVGTGMLEEQITAFDGCVLSVDVAAFNEV
ncbi:hypothetical protein MJG53_006769 [Ovis ammon polii x Ovis aries]|uniref:Uncharacterized protein n=1 Tax=Ovis ammon polii x Ovis aries TaxID=2918886 RepID=A0ACB9V6Y6_9CETA|nr:hypothetical protein MJG53_006769 [Ovis ammon polii x Ovis aries]